MCDHSSENVVYYGAKISNCAVLKASFVNEKAPNSIFHVFLCYWLLSMYIRGFHNF